MIVADTNLIAYLLLPGPRADAAQAVYDRDPDWAAPRLWRSEFRSVLVQHIRHAGLTRPLADEAWAIATTLVTERDATPEAVLDMALSGSLSAYDAEFAALATHLSVPLVTDDKRLRQGASAVAVSLDTFASNA